MSGETPSDVRLVQAAVEGDRRAFELLYGRYAPWLSVRLRYRCAGEDLVDDVVQETFLAVWNGSTRLRDPERTDVAAWLWTIAIRRLVDAIRKEGAGRRRIRVLGGRRQEVEPAAEEQVLLGIEHGDLAGCLTGLSPELRVVIQATVLDGLTMREASALLGVPIGTVKTRAMRARQQLREVLA
jgi:RNA polymerase sigma-70 factor (ECF subfamily)